MNLKLYEDLKIKNWQCKKFQIPLLAAEEAAAKDMALFGNPQRRWLGLRLIEEQRREDCKERSSQEGTRLVPKRKLTFAMACAPTQ